MMMKRDLHNTKNKLESKIYEIPRISIIEENYGVINLGGVIKSFIFMINIGSLNVQQMAKKIQQTENYNYKE